MLYVPRKKDVLQELAVALYLTQQLNLGTTKSQSILDRVKERAVDALLAAQNYTGKIGEKELRDFLSIKAPKFTIDCKNDIVKGDTIRFQECVFNNKVVPPRPIGFRGIIALVIGKRVVAGLPTLRLRVVKSGGVWSLNEGEEIRRPLRIVTRIEVMRAPWEDETLRQLKEADAVSMRPLLKDAQQSLLKRKKSGK